VPNFVSIALFCRHLATNNQNFAVFWTSVLNCGVASWRQSEKVINTGAQLQTFPYPTASKSFLYLNAFMAKSCAQTDVEKRDGQTDKKLTVLAAPTAGEIRAPPNLAW